MKPQHPDTAFRVLILFLAVVVLVALFREWIHQPASHDDAWPTSTH